MSENQKLAFMITAEGSRGDKAAKKIMELARKLEAEGARGNVLELATNDFIATALEQIDPAFQGIYQQHNKDSLFAGLVRRVPAPRGQIKIGDLYPVGKMRKFDGKVVVNGWESAGYTLTPELMEWTGGIDNNSMAKLDSIFDQGFQKSLAMAADLPIGAEDEALAAMLEANTAAHIGATSAFFSATNPIPGTGKTFSNRVISPITTVAEVRTAVRKMQNALVKQLSVQGIRKSVDYIRQNAVLVCHPDKLELVQDAFEPGNMTNDKGVRLNDKSALTPWDIRYNPYTMTSSKLWLFMKGDYAPLVVAVQEEPNMITTIGVPGNLQKILHNGQLAQVRYAFKEGYGSPFAAVECAAS
jgi:hypothetical protein